MGFFDRLTAVLTGEDAIPDEVRDDLQLARAYLDRGDLDAAATRLQRLAAQHPRSGPVFVALGQIQLQSRQYDQAVVSFGRAVDVQPRSAAAWLGLGQTQTAADRRDQALHAFRKVVALTGPGDAARAHALAGRAEIALRDGEITRAVRELKRAHDIVPDDITITVAMGRALVAAGDRDGERWLLHTARAALSAADPELALQALSAVADAHAAIPLLRDLLDGIGWETPVATRVRPTIVAALVERLVDAGLCDQALQTSDDGLNRHADDPAVLDAACTARAAVGRYADALTLAEKRRTRLGSARTQADVERFITLALGAQDPAALRSAARDADPEDERVRAINHFLAGDANEDDVRVLLTLAPDDAARRFVARALAPTLPAPADLYGILQAFHHLASQPGPLSALAPRAARALEAYDRPLLVAVMGEFNAGKSSLVNALCGRALAPVGVTPTTATINVLRHGQAGGRVIYLDGAVRKLPGQTVAPFLQSLVGQDAGAIRAVEVFLPVAFLERMEIVDTPGLNAARAEHEALARGYLVEADAIIWVFAAGQAAKASEQQALRTAHAAGKPVIGVVNKADHLDPEERAAVLDHVRQAFGGCLSAVIAVSARNALSDENASCDPRVGPLVELHGLLATCLLDRERELKRGTAVVVLRGLLADAATCVQAAAPMAKDVVQPQDLIDLQAGLTGALARQRLQFGESVMRGLADANESVIELVRPLRLLDGLTDDGGESEQDFLSDVLEDVTERTVAKVVQALADSTGAAPETPDPWADLRARLADAARTAGARYSAFARGHCRGGVSLRVLRRLQSAGKIDRPTIEREMAGAVPDPERELFTPYAQAATALIQNARIGLVNREKAQLVEQTVFDERHRRPVDALARMIEALDP